MTTKTQNLPRRARPCFATRTLLAMLIAGVVQSGSKAQTPAPTFDTLEQAVNALYNAVKNDDQAMISQIIGSLAASDDLAQDKADREQFIRKYSEMHRLVKMEDGTAMLYIGAENWPFPVPLISSEGKWRFDPDAGAQEIVFRRVGENEMTTIDLCRSIAKALNDPATKHESVVPGQQPSHGYYFRLTRTSTGPVVLAYPSEYGSTGVMTFAVTPDGAVYERDFGPKTEQRAKAISQYKRDQNWHMAAQ